MKRWLITPVLGGMLLSATWTKAQPNDPPAAAPAVQAGAAMDQGTGVVIEARSADGRRGAGAYGTDGASIMIGQPGGPAIAIRGGADAAMAQFKRLAAASSGGGGSGGGGGFGGGGFGGGGIGGGGIGGGGFGGGGFGGGGGGSFSISSAYATLPGKTEKAAFLGVVTTRVTGALRSQLKLKAGLVVDSVEAKSSAADAGLQVHDVIEKCDDQWLINPAQFVGLVRMYKPGETVTLTVLREGERKKITAKLEERETYALDDDGNPFSTRPNAPVPAAIAPYLYIPSNSSGSGGGGAAAAGFGGPVPQIMAGGLGGAPLKSGFAAAFGDGKQQLIITAHDGHQMLTVMDSASGKQIFQGPIDTPEQRKAVPEGVRKKLEEMYKIKVKVRKPNESEPGFDYDGLGPNDR